jgi:hypothetical protein
VHSSVQDIVLSTCAAPGSANIGRRHWASHALTRCNAGDCARQLEALLREREPNVLRGALMIVSVWLLNGDIAPTAASQ